MRRLFGSLAILIGLVASVSAQDACGGADLIARMKREDPARYERLAAEAKNIAFGGARFFKLSKGAAAPSYLFGTMHSSDPRVLAWIDQIEPRLRASRAVAIENADINPRRVAPEAAFKFATMMIAKPGELMSERMPDNELDQIAAVAAPKMSMTPPAIKRLRPWALILSFAYPNCETVRAKQRGVLDFNIIARAEDGKIAIASLESIDDMLGALLEPPLDAQIDLLRSAFLTYPMAEDMLESMTRLLDRGETGLLTAYARDESVRTLKRADSYDIFMRSLIDRRNAGMFRTALPLAAKGGAFLAVGALHLPGDRGLAKMFADAGYKVEPIMLTRTTKDD